MSNSQDLQSLVTRFHDAMDASDFGQMRELVSPDVRASVGGHDLDFEAFLGMGKLFMAAFPDGTHEVEQLIVAGDQTITRTVWRGTHTGDFQGMPPTGREVSLREIVIDRWVDGRLTEHFAQFDSLGLMQQLGAIPGAGD